MRWSTPQTPSRARAVTLLVVTGVLLAGCPRPVRAPAAATTERPTSLVPADALLVARLSPAPQLQAAVRTVLPAADRPGGVLEGSRARLRESLGVDPLSKLTLALSGLDDGGALTLAVRPRGELVVVAPVGGARRYDDALRLVFGRDGGTQTMRGPVRVWAAADGRARALERRIGDRSVLALAPDDEVASAALLASLDQPGFSLDDDEGFPIGLDEPAGRVPGEIVTAWTTPAAQGLLNSLVWLPAAEGPWVVRGALRGERLIISARAPSSAEAASSFQPPAGSCALRERALAWAELPAAWLPDELADGRSRLAGQVAVGVLPFAAPLDTPRDEPFGAGHLVLIGTPASPEARADLIASFETAVEGVAARHTQIEGLDVFSLPAPGAPWRQLSALVGEGTFVLYSGDVTPTPDGQAALVTALRRPCGPTASRARLTIMGDGLRARLPTPGATEGPPGAAAAMLRLLGRGLVGVTRADVEVRSLPGVLLLDATISLAP